MTAINRGLIWRCIVHVSISLKGKNPAVCTESAAGPFREPLRQASVLGPAALRDSILPADTV